MVAVKKQKQAAAAAKPEGISSALTRVVKTIKKSDEKKKAKEKSEDRKGIIMLNHIPHGFYEKELLEFFKQFGRVLRVKVARSKKTGKSKGYAYVQFQLEEVAKIAADSMDNYLMFERLVKCKLLGPEVNAKKIFADSHIKEDSNPGLRKQETIKANQEIQKSAADRKVLLQARVLNLKRQNSKLAALGIDYEFTPPELPSLVLTDAVGDTDDTTASEVPAELLKIHGRKKKKPKKEGDKSKAKKPKKSKLKLQSESPKVVKTIKKKPKARKMRKGKVLSASVTSDEVIAEALPDALAPVSSKRKSLDENQVELPALKKKPGTPRKSPGVAKSPKSAGKNSPKAKSPKTVPQALNQSIEDITSAVTVGTPLAKSPAVSKSPKSGARKSPKAKSPKTVPQVLNENIEETPASIGTPRKSPNVTRSPKSVGKNSPKAKSPKVVPQVLNQDIETTPAPETRAQPSPANKKQRKSEERARKFLAAKNLKANEAAQSVRSNKAQAESSQVTGTPSPVQSKSPKAKLTPNEIKSLKMLQKYSKAGAKAQPNKSPKLNKSVESAQPSSPSLKGKSPQAKKRKSDVSIEGSEVVAKSPKSPKLSLAKEVTLESELIPSKVVKKDVAKKVAKKSDDFKAKMSPKLLRSKNRQSEVIAPADIEPTVPKVTAKVTQKKNTPVGKKEKPKFSPKVLRSKGKKSENLSDTLDASTATEMEEKVKATPTTKATKLSGKKSIGKAEKDSPKEKKLPKFSPKVLRSRGRQSESSPAVVSVGKATRGRKSMK